MTRLLQALGILITGSIRLAAASSVVLSVQTGHHHVGVAAFSPDGRLIVTGGGNIAVLWDAATGTKLRVFAGHTNEVTTASFSPDGRQLLTGSHDGTVRLWDAATGREVDRIPVKAARITKDGREREGFSGVDSAVFSPNARQILTGAEDGRARLWDLDSGRQTQEFITVRGTALAMSATCAAFSPDGRQVLTSTLEPVVQLWDAATGQELRRFAGRNPVNSLYVQGKGFGDPVVPVAFSPSGRLALSGGDDKTLRLWNTATGKELQRFPRRVYGCNSAAFSKDGSQLVIAGTVSTWDTATGRQLHQLHGSGNLIPDEKGQIVGVYEGADDAQSVAYSPDGRLLLVGAGLESTSLWEAATEKLVRKITAKVEEVSALSFSPDSRKMFTSGPHLWDMTVGDVIPYFELNGSHPPLSRRMAPK